MKKNIRQLAAIMFTDMVGYTALMQEDENKAIKNRERHRNVLEQSIQDHHGQTLQYYGDGTLSIFGSVVEAIECAVEIQQELQKEPKIPLRIGMHVGDIVYSDDGIYGDAVNIASRIEKLSVLGGVLISGKVYDEIKNHNKFSATSLGEFELKNVKRPIELFSITNEGLQIRTKKGLKSSKWKKATIKVKDTQYPLLETKLYVPQPRPDLVQRTHLIDRLNKGINKKLTLISAPAGFGKTTLVCEWISESEIPVAWISLDKGDSDPVHFFHYLIAAFQSFDVNIGEPALTMLRSPQQPPIESIMANLIKEISDIPHECVLILDDYHSIDSKQIHNIVEFLLDHLPVQLHLVIATRVDPLLPLARLRVRNQLNEFRAFDLSFTMNETSVFFNQMMNLELSSDEISILESRTEGWIAGLQLAALSIQKVNNIQAFIKSFAGNDRHIVDYLAEEVLNLQPQHIRSFLLQTSILNRLSGPLCDFVTEKKDSQKILNELERANLFIVPLDNNRYWYRYHHLFADLLRQQLHQAEGDHVLELHRRASIWCSQNGLEDEAIDHALAAQDFEWVALLIGNQADAIWERGEHTKFRSWIERLPDDLVLSNPKLSILHAESLMIRWRIDGAEQSLQAAEQAFNPSTDRTTETSLIERDQMSSSDRIMMRGRVAVNRALIASFREDVPGIIQHANQALECLPEQELTWRSTVAIVLGDAHSIKGDLVAAHRAQLEALEVCKVSGNPFLFLIANVNLAVTMRQQGQLQQTLNICQQQVQFASENEMSQTVVVGWFLSIWGEVLAELNDLNGAIDNARKGVELTERSGDAGGMLCQSYLCLLRILFSKGNMADAKEIIQKLENIARESSVPTKITSATEAWKARIWLAQDKLDPATQWVRKRGLDIDGELPFLHEDENVVLARILIAQGRLDESTRLQQRLHESTEAGGRTTRVIEIWLLQALTFQADGDRTQAMAALNQALTLAEPENYIRIFIDEGPPMAKLLEQILKAKTDVPQAYVKKLLSAFRLNKLIETDDGLVERLSERELEVLRLIAAGLSSMKITEELFISLSTVKTHISNIYSKLDVHSRTEAIVKAKKLFLL